jgi:DNA-binding response OmpR family regulator/serine/threonine protein kinase
MPRILIVEDNKLNREMLSRRLTRKGFEVECAADGRQGVDMALAWKPDLILLDMSLPVMDGWQAVRELKATPEGSNIPVIALTAHAMVGDRDKAIEAGCDEYETKPVELPRLLAKMQTILDKYKPAPSPRSADQTSLLLIDDHTLDSDLSAFLQKNGFHLTRVRTGAEALGQLQQGSIDVVLMNLKDPSRAGIEILGALRAEHEATELPIIVAMGRDQHDETATALEHGANDYVTKPFHQPLVLARLQTHLRLRNAQRGAASSDSGSRQLVGASSSSSADRPLVPPAPGDSKTRIIATPWPPPGKDATSAPRKAAAPPAPGTKPSITTTKPSIATSSTATGRRSVTSGASSSASSATPEQAQPAAAPSTVPQSISVAGYEVLEELGRGGMGVVFKARHERMNRMVALKIINKDHLTDSNGIRRFYREIQAAGQMQHPNIVTAYDAGQCGDTHYFAMEYIEGIDLGKWVKTQGPIPAALASEFIRQAALGLQHAHECGMVHRDIKPANLLVTTLKNPSGRFRRPGTTAPADSSSGLAPLGQPLTPAPKYQVKLTDLGLALLFETVEPANASALTREGRVVGTADYMAPEQWKNAHKVDIRADLYSLGCTFYYLLTGAIPFPCAEVMEKMLKHYLDEAKPIEEYAPDVPPSVAAIVRRLMAKKPEDRFQEPIDLADALLL